MFKFQELTKEQKAYLEAQSEVESNHNKTLKLLSGRKAILSTSYTDKNGNPIEKFQKDCVRIISEKNIVDYPASVRLEGNTLVFMNGVSGAERYTIDKDFINVLKDETKIFNDMFCYNAGSQVSPAYITSMSEILEYIKEHRPEFF